MKLHYRLVKALVFLAILLVQACTVNTQHQFQIGQASFQQQNYLDAYKQLLPLAEKGNADAQYAIGYMYFYGKGVKQDPYEAKKWMQLAAAQNQALAIQALSVIK